MKSSFSFQNNRKQWKRVLSVMLGISIGISSGFNGSTPTKLWAQGSSLPDEVDFRTYQAIYLQSKGISDGKRANVNAILADLARLTNEIETIQREIADNQSESAQLDRRNDQLDQVIGRLIQENRDLQNERSNLVQRANDLERQVTRLIREIQDIDGRIGTISQEVGVLQGQIETLDREIGQTQQELDRLQSKRQEIENQIQVLNQNLRSSQLKLQRFEQILTEVQQTLATLPGQIKQLEAHDSALEARTRQLIQEEAQATTIYNRLAAAIRPLEAKLNQSKSALSRTDQRLEAIQAKLQDVRGDVRETSLAIAKKQRELKAAQEKGDQTAVNRIQAEIAQLENRKAGLEANAQTLESERREVASVRSGQAQQVAADQAAYDQNAGEYQQARERLQAIQQQLRETQARKTQVDQELSSKRRELDQARARLQSVQSEIAEIRRDIVETERNLNANQAILPRIQAQIAQKDRELRSRISDREVLFRRYEERVSVLNSEQRQRDAVNQRYVQVQSQYDSTVQRINEIDRITEDNIKQVDQSTFEQQQNRQRIQVLAAEEIQLRQTLIRVEAQYASTLKSYELAEVDAQNAETKTAADFDAYNIRKQAYDRAVAEAQELGRRQAISLASLDAKATSDVDGTRAGQAEAQSYGKTIGGLNGFIVGLRDGQTQGRDQGYQKGLNAPENYRRGFEAGEKAGIQQAQDEARQVSYPEGRRVTREQLLNQVISKSVQIDNGTAPLANSFRAAGDRTDHLGGTFNENLKDVHLEMGFIDGGLTPQSSDADESVNSRIARSQKEIADQNQTLSRLRVTKVNPSTVHINLKDRNCQQNVSDFKVACESAYEESFRVNYKQVYADNYLAARNDAFDRDFTPAVKSHETDRVQEGFDLAFPLVFAKWESKGAADAERKGFQEGKAAGYAATIGPAKSEAYALGVKEEQTFFATRDVVKLKGGLLESRDKSQKIIPGARVVLNLDVTNFGSVGSKKDSVRVTVLPLTRNISFDRTSTGLVEIPGLTRASIRNVVVGEVARTAKWNEEIRFQVRIEDANGFSETKEFRAVTQFGLNFVGSIETAGKPIIGGFLGIFITHDVKVNLKNESPNVEGRGFRLVGVNPEGFPDMKFKKTENTIGALGINESGKTNLSYEIRNPNYAGKQIPIEVIVYYDGNREIGRIKTLVVPVK